MDRCDLLEMPFHGGNRGSNPLGDANQTSSLETHRGERLTNLSQRRGWTGLENARFGALLPRPTGKLGDARNAARSYLIVLNRPERQPKGGH